MDKILRYTVILFFVVAAMGEVHAQVVDTSFDASYEYGVDDSIPTVDSLALLRGEINMLTQRLDSSHVVQATMRRRMRELIALKDSLVYINDLYQNELQDIVGNKAEYYIEESDDGLMLICRRNP